MPLLLRLSNLPPTHPAKACKVDAEANCQESWLFGYKAGSVISCLRWAERHARGA